MFERILAATDLGPNAARAVELALGIATRDEAELVLVHVFEIPTYIFPGAAFTPVDCLGPLQEEAEHRFEDEVAALRGRWARLRGAFRVGDPAEQIVAAISELEPDLVVVGTHGRHGLSHALLGSVAEKVVRHSPAPVLVVRERPREAPAAR